MFAFHGVREQCGWCSRKGRNLGKRPASRRWLTILVYWGESLDAGVDGSCEG